MEEHFFRRIASHVFVICLIVSCIFVVNTRSVSASYIRYVTADSLSIRTKASMEGEVVDAYTKGTKVTCYETSGSWTKVKYNGVYRYVSTKYLSAKKPQATTSSSSSSSGSTYTRYVNVSDYLTIRKKASSSSASIGTYARGDKATCYGTSGGWTKVKKSGVTGYVATSYLSTSKPSTSSSGSSSSSSSSSTYTRYVNASDYLTIRKKASASSTALGTYSRGEQVTCYGTSGGWTKVKKNGTSGYVATNYLSTSKQSSTSSTVSSASGTTIANAALKYRGLKYVWGGESLTKGVDCSGFTMAIYERYGYYLPHSAKGQRSSGRGVSSSDRKAGDLICYTAKNGIYHVGIYIGNNKVVHASSPKTGVTVSTWNYRTVYCVRRIIN